MRRDSVRWNTITVSATSADTKRIGPFINRSSKNDKRDGKVYRDLPLFIVGKAGDEPDFISK